MIFYESPHRTAATLADFVQTFGADRRGTVNRELTKLHEEVRRGTLAELAEWAESERVRGEIVIIVEGAQAPKPRSAGRRAAGPRPCSGRRAPQERLRCGRRRDRHLQA